MIFMLPKPYLGFVGNKTEALVGNKTEALVGYKTEVGVSGGYFYSDFGLSARINLM